MAGRTPQDDNGDRPEDVVRQFVEAVQGSDFEKAATYWRTGDVKNIEANSHMPFKDFCSYFFMCDNFAVTFIGQDKKSHLIAFRGQDNGREKTFKLFLQRINGRWRMVMNRFIQDGDVQR